MTSLRSDVFRRLSIVEFVDSESEELTKSTQALVLHGNDMYLSRYWNLKCEFESWLSQRLSLKIDIVDSYKKELGSKLKSVFKLSQSNEGQDLNWQAIAAAHALLQNTTFIAGGPGTGKTTTAASLLYLLDQSVRLRFGRPAKARLLAPTGKAAVRLADSIRAQINRIEIEQGGVNDNLPQLSIVLPENGETIHRFLIEHRALPSQKNINRVSAESLFLGKEATIETDADILIVDESSMIDLALMVALIKTISTKTQLIFMGDPYQLPPVEPGEVFAEQVRRFEKTPYRTRFVEELSALTAYDAACFDSTEDGYSFDKPLCYLRKTYRFEGDLKLAAEQINSGDFAEFRRIFKAGLDKEHQDKMVRWTSLCGLEDQRALIEKQVLEAYQDYFLAVKAKAGLEELEQTFSQFQLLCSTHEGEQGVAEINDLIEESILQALGFDSIYDSANFLYHGKAILITKNHADLGVFNGDVGFVLQNESSNSFRVVVPQGGGDNIVVSPIRLKSWLPAYAMTVHKSQGSEYQHVGLLLADYAKELLSRPLVYTGLTRAKQSCKIWATEEALIKAFINEREGG